MSEDRRTVLRFPDGLHNTDGSNKMRIEDQFNKTAEEYDVNRRKFIPCFDDFYDNTTAFIASNIRELGRIVDTPFGTGRKGGAV